MKQKLPYLLLFGALLAFSACKKDDEGGSSSSNGVPTDESLDAALQGPPTWDLQSTQTNDEPAEPVAPGDEFNITFTSGNYTTGGTIPAELSGAGFTASGTYNISGTMVRFNSDPIGPTVIAIDANMVQIRAVDLSPPYDIYVLTFTR